MNENQGILLINKPQKFTSFDVVAVLRRLLGTRRIGHTGTLDPMATGVLPLLVGSATRAASLLPDSDKTYIARFKLGIETDTLDIWGVCLRTSLVLKGRDDIEAVIPQFTGEIWQMPPMYSAVKKDGKRLYDLARQGIEIERESRKVTVRSLVLSGYHAPDHEYEIVVSCSSGTYIRTLISDMGQALGCGAAMTSLCRTVASGFVLEDSVDIEQARDLAQKEMLTARLIPVENAFLQYPKITVSEKQAVRFKNGGALDIARIRELTGAGIIRVADPNNIFIGLGEIDRVLGMLKILRLFPESSF